MIATDEQLTAQRDAITESGWGERFELVQPHNPASWAYLVLVVLGAAAIAETYGPLGMENPTALIGGVVIFAVLLIPAWWFLRHEDRYSSIPPRLAIAGMVWGAFGAIGSFALFGNEALLGIYGKAFGSAFAADWGPALTAPFNEELGKGAGILLLVMLAPRIIRNPFDGLILGAFVGLGFEVVEDLTYIVNGAVLQFGADQLGALTSVGAARIGSGLASHALFSAIFGAGLLTFLGTHQQPPSRARGVALMLLAMFFHCCWDAIGAITDGNGVAATAFLVVAPIVMITVLAAIYRHLVRQERAWLIPLLTPEVTRGTLRSEELAALAAPRRTRRKYVHDRPRHDRKPERRILTAAFDLANAIASADSADVELTRTHIASLRDALRPQVPQAAA